MSATTGLRADIQALRGFAVLMVVLYHADIAPIPQGFLGVDIFFVISGYLITGMVAKDFARGTFSFANFYFRRAKRLLPAAYVTFLLTAIAAPFTLGSQELADFNKQLIGALTFTGNIALFLQAGYFDSAAELKPLLHVWSLSLEEQYYLVLPALIALTPRRYWLAGGAVLLVLSLGVCAALVEAKPVATFFLLPTRAWELGIGSLAALIQQQTAWPANPRFKAVVQSAFWPAMLATCAIPFLPSHGPHPGIDAFVACMGTVLIILRGHTLFESLAPMKWLGDCSYSLYLVHWPIFAIIKNSTVGPLPATYQYAALGLSLLAGWALYRWVETPVRTMELRPSRRGVAAIVATSGALMAVSPAIASMQSAPVDFSQLRRPNDGFAKSCFFEKDFKALPECRSKSDPGLIVWGDSHAMHLVTGIARHWPAGVMQATRGMCGPILDMAPLSDRFYQRPWALDCIRFNAAVFSHIVESRHIDTVVLSSSFLQYLLRDDPKHHWRILKTGPDGEKEAEATLETAFRGVEHTVRALREHGKRVIVIASPPASGFNIGACFERKTKGMLVLGAPNPDCKIVRAERDRYQGPSVALWERLRRENVVEVIGFDELLCSGSHCSPTFEGTLLYADSNHFTHEGFALLANRTRLAEKIRDGAR
jgi:peptidoglycan/LPS O-acetylase OafA/YrhL